MRNKQMRWAIYNIVFALLNFAAYWFKGTPAVFAFIMVLYHGLSATYNLAIVEELQ
jgi:hypothetical protein